MGPSPRTRGSSPRIARRWIGRGRRPRDALRGLGRRGARDPWPPEGTITVRGGVTDRREAGLCRRLGSATRMPVVHLDAGEEAVQNVGIRRHHRVGRGPDPGAARASRHPTTARRRREERTARDASTERARIIQVPTPTRHQLVGDRTDVVRAVAEDQEAWVIARTREIPHRASEDVPPPTLQNLAVGAHASSRAPRRRTRSPPARPPDPCLQSIRDLSAVRTVILARDSPECMSEVIV